MSKPSLVSTNLIKKRRQALQGIQAAGCFGIPELKNPRYLACFKDGRRAHLKAYLAASSTTSADLETIPLYSHHATRQSLFAQGWRSVTELDRLRARARLSPCQFQPPHKEPQHG
ncbi:hypothetical protein [Aeromonas salmonicida]|uniref:hypothetical protein n=1 Tax=Aeromonas salmonicida TaxID=645 RepID=UPI0031FCC89F